MLSWRESTRIVLEPMMCWAPRSGSYWASSHLFKTLPGLARQIDTHDVLSAIGPRPTMVVSGTNDKYSRDAGQVVAKIASDFVTELRVNRGHLLDRERFDAIRQSDRPAKQMAEVCGHAVWGIQVFQWARGDSNGRDRVAGPGTKCKFNIQ